MQVDLVITNERSSLQRVLQALRRRLTLEHNLQCVVLKIADTGAVAPLTVEHKLGKVPTAYFYNLNVHGTVRDVNRATWTTTDMEIECSQANAQLTLVVF